MSDAGKDNNKEKDKKDIIQSIEKNVIFLNGDYFDSGLSYSVI